MRKIKTNQAEIIAGSLLILLLSAASYLALARNFGFYNDDWYLVYAGKVAGSGKFFEVFAIDRPFRAYLVSWMFDLLGLRAPLYALFSFAFRVAGALAMFWLLRQLWPARSRIIVLLAALFAIYPGWMDQPTGFDYQSHLLSFAFEVFSLAVTIAAWNNTRPVRRAALVALAVLAQVLSLLLMEYYIGMEALRLIIILYLAADRVPQNLIRRDNASRLRHALLVWLPFLAGAGGFLFWRTAIFANTRAVTDIGGMLGGLFASPVQRGLGLLSTLFQDFFNVTLVAWFVPLYQSTVDLRLRDTLIAIALGIGAALVSWAIWAWLRRSAESEMDLPGQEDGRAMFWIGSLGVIFALVPIALGERHITFPGFSRFTLPASVGAIMVLGGFLLEIRRESVRILIPIVLAGLAVMANYGNSVHYAITWAAMREFWWQVSWRAPQITPGTVLAVQYRKGVVQEDYFVWGPANLVYYPQKNLPGAQTRTPLNAVVLRNDSVQAILMGTSFPERERRGIYSDQDLGQTLVMSMPETGSCVHVFDGQAPELSHKETDRISRIASSSKIALIQVDSQPNIPPADLFGPEPAHSWCYYYEKASLARQQGDWEEVRRLGDEAIGRQIHPIDWVEWMPFVQAYAYLGDYEKANNIYPILADIKYLKYQACQIFNADSNQYAAQFPQGQAYLKEKYCQ